MEIPLNFNQAPDKSPHVLHPETTLPTFSYADAVQMTQPSSIFKKPEQPKSPSHEPKPNAGNRVLRPGDTSSKSLSGRMKALAMAGVVGLSGAMMTDNVEAGGIPGLEQAGKVIGTRFLNGVLASSPLAVTIDSQGNPLVVAKTPAQMAMLKPALREQGVEQIAASMGLSIIEQGAIFSISRNNNPADNIFINKFHNPGQYTTGIKLERAPNGGLKLSVAFITTVNGVQQENSQISIINVDQTGKIISTIIGS